MKSQIANRKLQIAKEILYSLLSAVLLILSFPRFNLEFLAWFGFVPLFFILENKSKFKAFLIFYFTGIIFWLGIIYWLVHVTLAGLIILVLYLALYFGIFGLLISHYSLLTTHYSLLFIPSVWVLLEYVRSHLFTGFPWALLGYSQYLNLPLIQIADITGVWGVSFLVILVNVLIYKVIGHRLWAIGKKPKNIIILPVLILILSLAYGYYRLYLSPITYHLSPMRISVIQGNIPQELKWDPGHKDFIIDRYLALTKEAVKKNPDLIVWPEAAMPVVLEEEPIFLERIKDLVKEVRIPLLFGAVTSTDELYYNSALLISDKGKQLNIYHKLHLVPFGEYIPLRKFFRFLETVAPIGDFTRGREYTIFYLEKQINSLTSWPVSQLASLNRQTGKPANRQTNFSVLICFEDIFPEISRNFVKKGADFLINITNDAWFKKTSSAYQHLQASVFRAVENRLPLVRSANTGVSGFIAPTGKIISLVQDKSGRNIFITGYDAQEIIIPKKELSFYTQYGDIFILLCFIFSLYGLKQT